MIRLLLIVIFIFIASCNGYKPLLSSSDIDFQLSNIEYNNSDKLSKKLSKKLSNFAQQNSNKKIKLQLNSTIEDKVLSKDKKGNPLILELSLTTEIKIISNANIIDNFTLNERFSFNNQSNKFDLKQYKNTITNNLTDKIFDKIILKLRML